MEDGKITDLFLRRDERALTEFSASYRRLCLSAAREITGSDEDAEECFSDTCLALWNSIPPEEPASLRAYALRICRNFALNRLRAARAQKRGAVLVELDECAEEAAEGEEADPREIGQAIDEFLEALPKREAVIFLRRYCLSEPVREIASSLGVGENKISKILSRLRRRLKKHLEERGIRV